MVSGLGVSDVITSTPFSYTDKVKTDFKTLDFVINAPIDGYLYSYPAIDNTKTILMLEQLHDKDTDCGTISYNVYDTLLEGGSATVSDYVHLVKIVNPNDASMFNYYILLFMQIPFTTVADVVTPQLSSIKGFNGLVVTGTNFINYTSLHNYQKIYTLQTYENKIGFWNKNMRIGA
jgi:hypothetical protein